MFINNIFSSKLPIIKITSSTASNTSPKEPTINNLPKKVSVLSVPTRSRETRPEMPSHDASLAEYETRQKLWSELALKPNLAEIKNFIEMIRADFTPEQQAQLAEVIKIGKAGTGNNLIQTSQAMRAVIGKNNNDSFQLFTKHLIELAQELNRIREPLLQLNKQKPSAELSSLIQGISGLIEETGANQFVLLNSGIIYKGIEKYIGLNPSISAEDLFLAVTEKLLSGSVKERIGFLGRVDISAIDPSTGKPYISVPYLDDPIRGAAQRELANKGHIIRLPAYLEGDLFKLKRIEEAWSKLDITNRPKFEEYYAQEISNSIISKAYSELNTKNKPTFENYYAQEIDKMREEAKIKLNQLKKILATVANPRSLDEVKPVNYFDPRYGDELSQVDVALENLTASNEELSTEDYTEKDLLNETLAEVLGTLAPQQKRVLELRYGLNDGEERSLAAVGDVLGLSRERIRQIEYQALCKLRQPRINHKLKSSNDEYKLPDKAEISQIREAYLANQSEEMIAEQNRLNNEINISTAKKVIQNHQVLLKEKLREAELLSENQINELLEYKNATEVQTYLKRENILFKNKEQYKQFTTLLKDYINSKTPQGEYKILQSILNPNLREQSKLLLANTDLNKETGADFMAYLRSLDESSFSLQESSEVTEASEISLEKKVLSEIDLIKSLTNSQLASISSISGIIGIIQEKWGIFGNNETGILMDKEALETMIYLAIDRLVGKNKEKANPYEGVIKRFRSTPKNIKLQKHLEENPETTFLEIYQGESIYLKEALNAVIIPDAKNIVPEIENMLAEKTTIESKPLAVNDTKQTTKPEETTMPEIITPPALREVDKTVVLQMIENYRNGIKAELRSLQVPPNKIEGLLECKDENELQNYLSANNIVFSSEKNYKYCLELLNYYIESKTREGLYTIVYDHFLTVGNEPQETFLKRIANQNSSQEFQFDPIKSFLAKGTILQPGEPEIEKLRTSIYQFFRHLSLEPSSLDLLKQIEGFDY